MRKRLFANADHPDLALSMNNLGGHYEAMGKLAEAETLFKDALAMRQRLYHDDSTDIAGSLSNLGFLYREQGKAAKSESMFLDALAMYNRLTVAYAKQRSQGEAISLLASQPLTRDGFLSLTRIRAAESSKSFDPATAYSGLWATKGLVTRVYEQRLLQARAATLDPTLAAKLTRLAEARRRRADLFLARATDDPDTLKQRTDDLKTLDASIAALNEELSKKLPALERVDRLATATIADLQQALPTDAVVVDYAHYTDFDFDNSRPAGEKERRTQRYLAFVITNESVKFVDLD